MYTAKEAREKQKNQSVTKQRNSYLQQNIVSNLLLKTGK